jgi:acetyl-CoA carboxylase, biotin carboxylase subunit
MYEAAIKIAEHVHYESAGTFEFIVDEQGHFYFLEMNTRLQVEHPVTEWVTGVDLVAWQLHQALGQFQLPDSPERRGSAVEVRLYAEDPQNFLPAPGRIGLIHLPGGPFVRSDSAFSEAGEVSVHYDPMIAKLSVWAPTRDEALARMRVALDEIRIESPRLKNGAKVGSLKTNLAFLKRLVRNASVLEGHTATDLIPKNPDLTAEPSDKVSFEAALAASLFRALQDNQVGEISSTKGESSLWAKQARIETLGKRREYI